MAYAEKVYNFKSQILLVLFSFIIFPVLMLMILHSSWFMIIFLYCGFMLRYMHVLNLDEQSAVSFFFWTCGSVSYLVLLHPEPYLCQLPFVLFFEFEWESEVYICLACGEVIG